MREGGQEGAMGKKGLQVFDQRALTALKTRPGAGAHRDRRRRRRKGRAVARRWAWELAVEEVEEVEEEER